MTEAELDAAVRDLAHLFGWRRFHTFDSRRSTPGFPDLVLLRPPRLLFVELKSEKGTLTVDQQLWLQDLSLVPSVEAHVWRPIDWDSGTIAEILRRKDPDHAQETT